MNLTKVIRYFVLMCLYLANIDLILSLINITKLLYYI